MANGIRVSAGRTPILDITAQRSAVTGRPVRQDTALLRQPGPAGSPHGPHPADHRQCYRRCQFDSARH